MDCVDCLSNDKLCCCPFFSKHELEKQSGKNFENVLLLKQNKLMLGEKSVAHIKLTFCFKIQVHDIEENIERQQSVIWLLLL